MDLSTDTSMILFGINGDVYNRSEAIAERQGRTVTDVVEEKLRSWLDQASREPEQTYVVQLGDTLAQIALKFFGDPFKFTLIAEYNGITEPAQFREGLLLRIPPLAEEDVQPLASAAARSFRFPLAKTETSYFKFGSIYPATSQWAGKPHPGVDFHEKEGVPVYAIGEGIVLVNQHDANGYGHYLMVEHTLAGTGDPVYSLYGHLQPDPGRRLPMRASGSDGSEFRSPKVGTTLRGENIQIGREGQTGYAGGLPHVHFEVKKTPDLGLYAMINTHNLRDYFYDPYTFIPQHAFVPI